MAGPLDEFVSRLMRLVAQFTSEHDLQEAEVRIELADGSRYVLATATSDPGFGFFSFTPHGAEGAEPRQLILPIGVVKLIEISAPDPERQFGFAIPE